MITYRKNGCVNMIHGKIKYISEDGFVIFRATSHFDIKILNERIVSFEEKEKQPAPTEYNGAKVIWDGGIMYYLTNDNQKKELNLNR